MVSRNLRVVIGTAILANCAFGQQFPAAPISLSYPELAQGCQQALNTSTQCPTSLLKASSGQEFFKPNELDALCTSACAESLQVVREAIEGDCAETDAIIDKGQAFPATFMVDKFIYAYNRTCLKDR